MIEFVLPELGENVVNGDVVRVLVNVGDTVAHDQAVLEIETDKATIEVPSSVAGTVAEVRVKKGDRLAVGQPIIVFTRGAAAADESPGPAASATPSPAQRPQAIDGADRRPLDEGAAEPLAASPSIRRFAREFGVDLSDVVGTGESGRIGQEDVKAHVRTALSRAPGRRPPSPLPDCSRWGDVDVVPMTNVRRKTAEHLTATWQAPHVTQHDLADMTALDAFRTAYAPRLEKAGVKLTVTAVLVKILATVLDRFPHFASSLDTASQTIVVKKYRHIGLAVDTPNGLVVPVVRDVNRKTLTELAVEIAALSKKAQERALTVEEMAGGVFTISNLGRIGGTGFTPLINTPEVAILGVSRGTVSPVWRDGQFVPRQLLPLALSYDHRVVDGADAARFLRAIADAVEHPLTVML